MAESFPVKNFGRTGERTPLSVHRRVNKECPRPGNRIKAVRWKISGRRSLPQDVALT